MSTLDLPLQDFLDREYAEDIHVLRQDFQKVNVRDPASLRDWFLTHPYLTVNDHVRIAGVCYRTVHRWRRQAGLTAPRNRTTPRSQTARPPAPTPPPDWRDTDWLERAYEHYSIPQLAKATGLNMVTVYRRLKRRRVQLRPWRQAVLSAHPCFKRSWLVEHYVNRGWSQARCAKLAGVSRYTIACWLSHFKIRIRSGGEQTTLRHVNDLVPEIGPST